MPTKSTNIGGQGGARQGSGRKKAAVIDKITDESKRVLIFVMVGIGHTLDAQILGGGDTLRTAVIFFYCANEGLSLIENAGHLGLPIPAKLKSVLAQLHNRAEDPDDTDKEDTDGKSE